jgi:hypothetical protein
MVTSNITKLHKPTKAERQAALAKLVVHGKKAEAPEPVKAVEPVKLPSPAPKAEMPKAEPKADKGDKGDTPKKKRTWSAHHLAWKATKDFPGSARIVVLSAENPKKRGAARKFAIYKRGPEGMTVDEYIEASHKTGVSKATAKEDIKWDWTAGFTQIDGKKFTITK